MKYFLFAFIIFTALSCRKDKVEEVILVEEECPEERSFSQDILPIINNNCSTSNCHNSNVQAGGYVFEDYNQIEQHADIMLTAISGPNPTMPQGLDPLPDSLIQTFDCWIKQGKLNN